MHHASSMSPNPCLDFKFIVRVSILIGLQQLKLCCSPELKLSSIGFKSGEYGGRKRRTQPVLFTECKFKISEAEKITWTLLLNHCAQVLAFVNGTVVQNQDTTILQVWVHLREM
jgi:hypothetical protein